MDLRSGRRMTMSPQPEPVSGGDGGGGGAALHRRLKQTRRHGPVATFEYPEAYAYEDAVPVPMKQPDLADRKRRSSKHRSSRHHHHHRSSGAHTRRAPSPVHVLTFLAFFLVVFFAGAAVNRYITKRSIERTYADLPTETLTVVRSAPKPTSDSANGPIGLHPQHFDFLDVLRDDTSSPEDRYYNTLAALLGMDHNYGGDDDVARENLKEALRIWHPDRAGTTGLERWQHERITQVLNDALDTIDNPVPNDPRDPAHVEMKDSAVDKIENLVAELESIRENEEKRRIDYNEALQRISENLRPGTWLGDLRRKWESYKLTKKADREQNEFFRQEGLLLANIKKARGL